MLVAKDAPVSATVSRTTPMRRVVRVPQRRVEIVVKGEIKRDCEIERPPTKAYSIGVALGKVLCER